MILMFGDVHRNFEHLVPVIKAEKLSAIIKRKINEGIF